MDKRQDTFHVRLILVPWLTVSLFFVLILAACQTDLKPLPVEPTRPDPTPTTETSATLQAPINTPTTQVSIATPSVDCLEMGGKVHSGSIFSEPLGEDLHYQVYLPPCYHQDVEKRYPVTYLLHGLSYDEEQWVRLGLAEQMDQLIEEGSLAPFIVVMPRETRFQPPGSSAFADALVDTLIPWVDQEYRTQPEKSSRAIGGLSRGAAWSVHISLTHPQLFSSVGAHSLPLFAIDGGRLEGLLTKVATDGPPSFFIDIGRGDPERFSAQDFADQLNAHHIPHTWYLFNGGHTEAYWSAHLDLYLRWYARDW